MVTVTTLKLWTGDQRRLCCPACEAVMRIVIINEYAYQAPNQEEFMGFEVHEWYH